MRASPQASDLRLQARQPRLGGAGGPKVRAVSSRGREPPERGLASEPLRRGGGKCHYSQTLRHGGLLDTLNWLPAAAVCRRPWVAGADGGRFHGFRVVRPHRPTLHPWQHSVGRSGRNAPRHDKPTGPPRPQMLISSPLPLPGSAAGCDNDGHGANHGKSGAMLRRGMGPGGSAPRGRVERPRHAARPTPAPLLPTRPFNGPRRRPRTDSQRGRMHPQADALQPPRAVPAAGRGTKKKVPDPFALTPAGSICRL